MYVSFVSVADVVNSVMGSLIASLTSSENLTGERIVRKIYKLRV
jgi:hypothetical protein